MSAMPLPSLSLMPIGDAPGGNATPPPTKPAREPFAWPTPPLPAYAQPQSQTEPEPCEVESRSGKQVAGQLTHFDPVQGVVRVLVPPERAALPMRLTQIRRIRLKRPIRPMAAESEADSGVKAMLAHLPRHAYVLYMADGLMLQGVTIGHVETVQGLFLFEPQDAAGTVSRCFVPRLAYQRHQIGEPIGAILAAQKAVAPELVERAAQVQQSQRKQRLGEWLLSHQLVTPEQLHEALDKQARVPTMRLGEALVALGFLSTTQLDDALQRHEADRQLPLGQLLLKSHLITTVQLQTALARKLGFPLVDVSCFPVELAALEALGHADARRLRVLPLMLRGGRLIVAMADASRSDVTDEVRGLAAIPVLPVLALEGALPAAIEAAYAGARKSRSRDGRGAVPAGQGDLSGPGQAAAAELDHAVSTLQRALQPTAPAAAPPVAPAQRQARPATPVAAPAATSPRRSEVSARTLPEITAKAVSGGQPPAATAAASATPGSASSRRIVDTGGAADGSTGCDAADAVLIRLVTDALERGANDIHIEARPGDLPLRVRMRRDDGLDSHQELSVALRSRLVARIKSLAGLDLAARRPQQGRLAFGRLAPAQPIDLRVTTIPTRAGLDDIVLRLPARLRVLPLDELGFSLPDQERLVRLFDRPGGLFLNVGPARSGRTTTMHALLAHLILPERRIWTAEERIELVQPELRQVEIDPRKGWGYEQALEAFRQADADVMMIDDLREPGAARIAVELAQSGRLVVAGLPARTVSEAISRLLDGGGVQPHDLADVLCGVHAQHLLRCICSHCRMSRSAREAEVQDWLELARLDLPGEAQPAACEALRRDWSERFGRNGRLRRYHSPGCPHCNHTGFRGRIAVHELLVPSRDLRRLIRASAPAWHVQRQATQDGLHSLHQDALEKMLAGLTAIEEVRCVASA